MPKNNIFTDKEAAFLKELVKQGVDFMLVGLGAAALQGAPVVTQDIDLWFKNLSDPNLKKALKKVNGIYVPPIGMHPPTFAGDHLELFDIVLQMDGLDRFQKEEKRTIKIPLGKWKIKVLPLDRIIKSKEAAGREKDKMSLKVLKDTWKTLQSKKKLIGHPRKKG